MVNLKSFEKDPFRLVDYYKSAINNPKEFCKSIDFDESLADSGVVIMVIAGVQSILWALIGAGEGIVTQLLTSFLGLGVGLAVGSLIVLLVATIGKAKVKFINCFNITLHSWILSLPFSFLGLLFTFSFTLSTIISFAFLVYVLIAQYEADTNRVIISAGVVTLLCVVPMMCVMLATKALENSPGMQEMLQGRTLEEFAQDMGDGNEDLAKAVKQMGEISQKMEKLKAILPPCLEQHGSGDNLNAGMFHAVTMQTQALFMAPPSDKGKLKKSLNSEIDKIINDPDFNASEMRLNDDQKDCLRKAQRIINNY